MRDGGSAKARTSVWTWDRAERSARPSFLGAEPGQVPMVGRVGEPTQHPPEAGSAWGHSTPGEDTGGPAQRQVLIVLRPPKGTGTAVSTVEGRKSNITSGWGGSPRWRAMEPLPAPQGLVSTALMGLCSPQSCAPWRINSDQCPFRTACGLTSPKEEAPALNTCLALPLWGDLSSWAAPGPHGGSAGTAPGPAPRGVSSGAPPEVPAGPAKGAFAV